MFYANGILQKKANHLEQLNLTNILHFSVTIAKANRCITAWRNFSCAR